MDCARCTCSAPTHGVPPQRDSDIDLLIDTTGTNIKSLLQVAAVYCELEEALGKPVDLVTVSSLEQEARMPSEESFRKTVWKEKVDIYVAA